MYLLVLCFCCTVEAGSVSGCFLSYVLSGIYGVHAHVQMLRCNRPGRPRLVVHSLAMFFIDLL